MTAARYYPPTPESSGLKESRRRLRRSQQISSNTKNNAKIKQINNKIPHSLQFLLLIHKSSATLTFCLVTITLAVYGWTVQAPNLWSQEFQKLTKLQRDERHLVGANEALKHQLAQQAQKPIVGLSDPHPRDLIFLPDVKVTPLSITNATTSTPKKPFVAEAPVAY